MGQKTMCQTRRRLSQMHATNYMPYIRKKGGFLKKYEPIGRGGAAAPAAPFESATLSTCFRNKMLQAGQDSAAASGAKTTGVPGCCGECACVVGVGDGHGVFDLYCANSSTVGQRRPLLQR